MARPGSVSCTHRHAHRYTRTQTEPHTHTFRHTKTYRRTYPDTDTHVLPQAGAQGLLDMREMQTESFSPRREPAILAKQKFPEKGRVPAASPPRTRPRMDGAAPGREIPAPRGAYGPTQHRLSPDPHPGSSGPGSPRRASAAAGAEPGVGAGEATSRSPRAPRTPREARGGREPERPAPKAERGWDGAAPAQTLTARDGAESRPRPHAPRPSQADTPLVARTRPCDFGPIRGLNADSKPRP